MESARFPIPRLRIDSHSSTYFSVSLVLIQFLSSVTCNTWDVDLWYWKELCLVEVGGRFKSLEVKNWKQFCTLYLKLGIMNTFILIILCVIPRKITHVLSVELKGHRRSPAVTLGNFVNRGMSYSACGCHTGITNILFLVNAKVHSESLEVVWWKLLKDYISQIKGSFNGSHNWHVDAPYWVPLFNCF